MAHAQPRAARQHAVRPRRARSARRHRRVPDPAMDHLHRGALGLDQPRLLPIGNQMRIRAGSPWADTDHDLLWKALGESVYHRLWRMRSHVRLGNTLFVHGGLDPHADTDEFLTRPWTIFTEARWAWINHGFL